MSSNMRRKSHLDTLKNWFHALRVRVKPLHRYQRVILYNTWNLEPKWIKQYKQEYNVRYDYHDLYSQSEVAQVQNSYATDGTSGLLLNPFDLPYDDIREADEIPF